MISFINLSNDQKEAIKLLDVWFKSKDRRFYLFGYGGTGKSFLCKEYSKKILDDVDKIYICSTTHPSLDVLKSQFMANSAFPLKKVRFMTVHKLLGFKPYIEYFSGER